MKFCPYCGASLMGGAVSFCVECGKHLPTRETKSVRSPPAKPQGKRKAPPPVKRKADMRRPVKGKHPNPVQAEKSAPPKRRRNPMDVNYDGYYDDVQPADAGQQGERMDPELIKRIVLLIVGALGVIILAAVLMSVL